MKEVGPGDAPPQEKQVLRNDNYSIRSAI